MTDKKFLRLEETLDHIKNIQQRIREDGPTHDDLRLLNHFRSVYSELKDEAKVPYRCDRRYKG